MIETVVPAARPIAEPCLGRKGAHTVDVKANVMSAEKRDTDKGMTNQ